MYNKVKELLREGLSIRQISRNTGLDRVTVRKYLRMTEEEFSDFLALQKQRNRKLQPYEEFIKKRVTDYPDCSSAQVEDWLKEHHPDLQEVTTRTIYSFVQWIRKSHDIPKPKGTPRYYQPVEQLPYGEQAQVDLWSEVERTLRNGGGIKRGFPTIFGREAAQTERSGERACMVALPQPAANGAFAGVDRSECGGLAAQTERSGVRRLSWERFDTGDHSIKQLIFRLTSLKNPLYYKRIHGLSALNLSRSRPAVPA